MRGNDVSTAKEELLEKCDELVESGVPRDAVFAALTHTQNTLQEKGWREVK